MNSNLLKYNKTKNTLIPYISKSTLFKLRPNECLKRAYGILKKQKIGEPLRPIVSSVNSVTAGAEEYLLNIIQPLLDKCTYSLKSTKHFKEEFLAHRHKFDSQNMECVSFDAKSLFTCVNVRRTVKYICDIIYQKPDEYFKEYEEDSENSDIKIRLPIPPRSTFEEFFISVLLEFSSFSTLNGYYTQIQGLSMGSKLSPALANIFCDMMEKKVINKYINKEIAFYQRYVDDVFCILKKGQFQKILNEMNAFDDSLSFSVEKMEGNSITFLDTSVYIDSTNKLQLKQYKKPSASNVILNFKKSVTPTKYKISTLVGEIYRCNNTTTTEKDLSHALNDLKKIFIKNGYPERMINSKISEVKSRKFSPSPFKILRERDFEEHPERNANISLPFTSERCEKIVKKIIKTIKNVTPLFKVNFCWQNIKMERFFSPKLKLSKPILEQNALVYKFTCDCELVDIGETKRRLKKCIEDHYRSNLNSNQNTAIRQHITTCTNYKEILSQNLGGEPSRKQRLCFL